MKKLITICVGLIVAGYATAAQPDEANAKIQELEKKVEAADAKIQDLEERVTSIVEGDIGIMFAPKSAKKVEKTVVDAKIDAFLKEYLGVQFGDKIDKFPEGKGSERTIPVLKKFKYFDKAKAYAHEGKLYSVEFFVEIDKKYSQDSVDEKMKSVFADLAVAIGLDRSTVWKHGISTTKVSSYNICGIYYWQEKYWQIGVEFADKHLLNQLHEEEERKRRAGGEKLPDPDELEAEKIRVAEEADNRRVAEEAEKRRMKEEAEKRLAEQEAEKRRAADEAMMRRAAEKAENANENNVVDDKIDAFLKEYIGVQFGDSIDKYPEKVFFMWLSEPDRKIPVKKKFKYFDKAQGSFCLGRLYRIEFFVEFDEKYSVDSINEKMKPVFDDLASAIGLESAESIYRSSRIKGCSYEIGSKNNSRRQGVEFEDQRLLSQLKAAEKRLEAEKVRKKNAAGETLPDPSDTRSSRDAGAMRGARR